jgi:hypothetical protein
MNASTTDELIVLVTSAESLTNALSCRIEFCTCAFAVAVDAVNDPSDGTVNVNPVNVASPLPFAGKLAADARVSVVPVAVPSTGFGNVSVISAFVTSHGFGCAAVASFVTDTVYVIVPPAFVVPRSRLNVRSKALSVQPGGDSSAAAVPVVAMTTATTASKGTPNLRKMGHDLLATVFDRITAVLLDR